MSEDSKKTKETPESTAESSEESQAQETKGDEAPVEAQASEDQPKASSQKPAAETKTAEADTEKPLEKRTVKELREMAKGISGITGVHAMKKDELIDKIKQAKGVKDVPVKKASSSTRELKIKIKALKLERQAALEAKDKKLATIYRRRISRLKKKTRKVAA